MTPGHVLKKGAAILLVVPGAYVIWQAGRIALELHRLGRRTPSPNLSER